MSFFRNSIKDDNINPEVHNLQSLVHNIETVQCPTPMQTDEDSQMKLSDCLTVWITIKQFQFKKQKKSVLYVEGFILSLFSRLSHIYVFIINICLPPTSGV